MNTWKQITSGLFVIIIGFIHLSEGQGFQCGQCKPAGSCDKINGVYEMTTMSKGYNPVLTIPAWACYINVTEVASSGNHLAIKDANGEYILNGRWSVQDPGVYEGVGTRFRYGRVEVGCPGECLSAVGPSRDTITVQLLYLDRNPGIYYSYEIPKGSTAARAEYYPERHRETRDQNSKTAELKASSTEYRHFRTPSPTRAQTRAHEQQTGAFPEFSPFPKKSEIYRQRPIFTTEFKHRRRYKTSRRHRGDRTRTRASIQKPYDQHRRQELRDSTYSRGEDENSVLRETFNDQSRTPQNSDLIGAYVEDENSVTTEGSGDRLTSSVDEYLWKLARYTECSRICGGGTQHTMYVCVHTSTDVAADEQHCASVIEPEVQHRVCNAAPCTPSWKTDTWSPCSTTCGRGSQSRNITCQQRMSATDSQPLPDKHCTSQKPVSVRECYRDTCYMWVTGKWSDCSVQCGVGSKRRQIQCRNRAGLVVNNNRCDQSLLPAAEASCDMGSCTRQWFYSKWTDMCWSDCEGGRVTRHVHCATDSGRVLSKQQCDITDKPSSEKACSQETSCGGKWFTGPWGECSHSCGEGEKKRFVLCMRKVGDQLLRTADENCTANDKPETSITCTHKDCGNLWYMSEWSECSKSCDGGVWTRAVQCISDDLHPSTLCTPSEKPETSQSCNTNSCSSRTTPLTLVDRGCVDKYPNCKVVIQAGLCRFPYYQRKCCNSCSNSGRIYRPY